MDRFTVYHEHSYELTYEGNFHAGHVTDYVRDTETGKVWDINKVVEWMNQHSKEKLS
jgi:hypothetical protein